MRPTSRLLSLAGIATAALLFAAACSSAAATPVATVLGATQAPATQAPATSPLAMSLTVGVTNDATLGSYLTGLDGMTLYVFSADSADTSTCTGACAAKWPPLIVDPSATITPPAGATGAFSLITRADGTMQVAYNHQPLYYYTGDAAAGDATGQGFGGKWFVAPLTASASSGAASPAATPAAVPTATIGY